MDLRISKRLAQPGVVVIMKGVKGMDAVLSNASISQLLDFSSVLMQSVVIPCQ